MITPVLIALIVSQNSSGPLTDFGNEDKTNEVEACSGFPEHVGSFRLMRAEGHEDNSMDLIYVKRINKDAYEIVTLHRSECKDGYAIISHEIAERQSQAKCVETESTKCL